MKKKSSDYEHNLKQFTSNNEKHETNLNSLEEIKKEVQTLSYEETIKAFDEILQNLQNDDVAVHDLQRYYLKGNIYLEHCEQLLSQVEQEVFEMDYKKSK